MAKYIEEVWMNSWVCGECGTVQAVAQSLWEDRQRTGKGFQCFNGHSRAFRETTEMRLKAELAREVQKREAAEERAKLALAEQKVLTRSHRRMRARVANGVCPCCNRSFQNLMQHMQTEHPGFAAPKAFAALRNAFSMTQRAVALEIGTSITNVSNYEHDRPVPEDAKALITAWLKKHQGAEA